MWSIDLHYPLIFAYFETLGHILGCLDQDIVGRFMNNSPEIIAYVLYYIKCALSFFRQLLYYRADSGLPLCVTTPDKVQNSDIPGISEKMLNAKVLTLGSSGAKGDISHYFLFYWLIVKYLSD